jgi:hypothetical protein
MNYRELVEQAGAEFIGVERNSVLFRDGDGPTLTLYTFACRSVEDVALALKGAREKRLDFPPLLPRE